MSEAGTALRRTLKEVALYPPKPPRKPTALYLRSHHDLVVVKDLPCLVCGVRNSDLQDPARRDDETVNYWGAKAIETHHRLVEDGLANAIDLAKFNAHVLPGLLKHYGDERYKTPFTQEQMLEWIHGDPHNLWCLCDVHHRHPFCGIHSITAPIWSVQHLLVEGYDLTGYHPHSPQEGEALTRLPSTTGLPVGVASIVAVQPGETAEVVGPAQITPTPGARQ